MAYELAPPATPDEWQAFHDIRRTELFERKGRHGVYDPNHPHDRDPRNEPLLLRLGGRPVGTVRLDNFGDGTGCVRMVAVIEVEQGRGHGRELSRLVDELARSLGIHTLYVNAAPEAVGFYEKGGWVRHVWDPVELAGIAEACVQMRKPV